MGKAKADPALATATRLSQVKCLPIRANVTSEAEFQGAIAQAVAEFGRIDYAANFAGIGGPHKHISEITVEEWEQVLAVNTTGVFISTKHELLQMMKQDSVEVYVPFGHLLTL
ncbi:hypothetical protein A1O3_00985 [Capronia epimyces CBS 606.96]|uniref:3-oxoacyl-[acyl-carrier protein] reductase n=1 Tax=Capronia epimyces CBS 606.96 TaxID=1182542 RepID=W9ZD51_9EURO|nr:uncharacterized protein A1O3_00985 [Capronia epimyces CBS 606.96]EXJ92434.1 hypothetical protein A1O3_00985 [Capronia epimyces CBS 606.96]